MDFQVSDGRVGTVRTIFDDVDERPVDCEFVLPDYLPEIAAVLKCRVNPVVQSHQISGDRVVADGTVYLQLLYLDEDRCMVRSYEHTQPFSSTFTVKELKSGDAVQLSARVNYVNCRAVGPRRVDVHGAFGVRLFVKAEGYTDVVGSVSGDGLHTRGREIACSVSSGYTEKTISLNEVLELETAAETLIRHEAAAYVTECRQMPGKVIVKGDVVITAVYVAEERIVRTTGCIPFSQILDVDDMEEEALSDCRACVTQCDVRLMQDPAGEMRLLSAAVKVFITMERYRTETHTVVTDAYHTSYPLKTEWCSVDPCLVSFVRTDTAVLSMKQALPDGDVTDVLDLWCDALTATCTSEMGQTAVDGQMQIGLLVRDANGLVSYYERVADYRTLLPDACEEITVAVVPLECTYTVSNGAIDIQTKAMVHRVGQCTQHVRAVMRMTADETAPYTAEGVMKDCCLKVCFADGGESLWEIARREHTSYEELMAENGLMDDVLEKSRMLIIPV